MTERESELERELAASNRTYARACEALGCPAGVLLQNLPRAIEVQFGMLTKALTRQAEQIATLVDLVKAYRTLEKPARKK